MSKKEQSWLCGGFQCYWRFVNLQLVFLTFQIEYLGEFDAEFEMPLGINQGITWDDEHHHSLKTPITQSPWNI